MTKKPSRLNCAAIAAIAMGLSLLTASISHAVPLPPKEGVYGYYVQVEATEYDLDVPGQINHHGIWQSPFIYAPSYTTPPKTDSWSLPGTVDDPAYKFMDGDDVFAQIVSLSCAYDYDPVVSLSFALIAGNSTTTFTVSSAVVSFLPMVNPDAYATAKIGVTDRNGDGATLTGLFPTPGAYAAQWQGGSYSNWAELIAQVVAPVNGSTTVTERKPALPTTYGTISGTVTDIKSEFNFTLTSKDLATGSSTFEVVPEPGTILALGSSLCGFAGLILRRRAV